MVNMLTLWCLQRSSSACERGVVIIGRYSSFKKGTNLDKIGLHSQDTYFLTMLRFLKTSYSVKLGCLLNARVTT